MSPLRLRAMASSTIASRSTAIRASRAPSVHVVAIVVDDDRALQRLDDQPVEPRPGLLRRQPADVDAVHAHPLGDPVGAALVVGVHGAGSCHEQDADDGTEAIRTLERTGMRGEAAGSPS